MEGVGGRTKTRGGGGAHPILACQRTSAMAADLAANSGGNYSAYSVWSVVIRAGPIRNDKILSAIFPRGFHKL